MCKKACSESLKAPARHANLSPNWLTTTQANWFRRMHQQWGKKQKGLEKLQTQRVAVG